MTKMAYTMLDTVEATGLSRSSIYKAISAGDLKAHKSGRRVLILVSDLEAFMKKLPMADISPNLAVAHDAYAARAREAYKPRVKRRTP